MTDPKEVIGEWLKALGYPVVKRCTITCNWETGAPILIDIEALVCNKDGELLYPLIEKSACLEVNVLYDFEKKEVK